MNVWNKVLMALTTLVCLGYGVFAANKYQFTKSQEEGIAKLSADIERVQAEVETLRCEVYGGDASKTPESWHDYGLDEQLKYVRGLQKGSVYTNCDVREAPVRRAEGTAAASFIVDSQYQTSSFRQGSLVFVFDSGKPVVASDAASEDEDVVASVPADDEEDSEAGEETAAVAKAAPYTFLGVFKVSGVANSEVKINSIGVATDEELDLIQESKKSGNSWVVYVDSLPIDSPEDLAWFAGEYSDRVVASSADFVSKSFTIDNVKMIADAMTDGADSALPDFSESDSVRCPVDFQGAIERDLATRDALGVIKAQAIAALEVFTNVVADQFVLIGDKATDPDVLAFENWDDIYNAAVNRKKVPSLREQLAEREASVADMQECRDLVKKTLDESKEIVSEFETAIENIVKDNARLASELARAQFAVVEKIQRENAAKTAAAEPDLSFNDI